MKDSNKIFYKVVKGMGVFLGILFVLFAILFAWR